MGIVSFFFLVMWGGACYGIWKLLHLPSKPIEHFVCSVYRSTYPLICSFPRLHWHRLRNRRDVHSLAIIRDCKRGRFLAIHIRLSILL
jgi:hypothetical protein